ncbi:hypothetical protein [Bartonella sp. DGB1]|uniref:hypothetical protein n=1 Tax=Bartonella sp. DGB1 TaxID=3239807 RepID=UPI003526058D
MTKVQKKIKTPKKKIVDPALVFKKALAISIIIPFLYITRTIINLFSSIFNMISNFCRNILPILVMISFLVIDLPVALGFDFKKHFGFDLAKDIDLFSSIFGAYLPKSLSIFLTKTLITILIVSIFETIHKLFLDIIIKAYTVLNECHYYINDNWIYEKQYKDVKEEGNNLITDETDYKSITKTDAIHN